MLAVTPPVESQSPAADMLVEYAAPLFDAKHDSEQSRDRALGLALMFWTLAQMSEAVERQCIIDETADALSHGCEIERQRFRRLALRMVRRHHIMFPSLYI
jgi:hypothetical protein